MHGLILMAYEYFIIFVFVMLLLIDTNSIARAMRSRKNGPPRNRLAGRERTLVIVPCKGEDLTLKENLESIKKQRYNYYKIIAVLDSENDPAKKAVKEARIPYIISKRIGGEASGKVKAIVSALEKFKDYDIYVVADSDINVDGGWLGSLTGPLTDPAVGISTMFPYFKPMKGFWSKVKLVWGFVGESLLENEKTRFAWGGSMAFRKDLIDKDAIRFMLYSRYSISDDICLTRIARGRGLSIAFAKRPQPVVNSDDDFSRFWEWSNRQTALAILGYRENLYLGLLFYGAEMLAFASGIALSILVSPLFLLLFLHLIKSLASSYRRAHVRDPALAIAVIIAPFVYFANLVIGSRMKSIRWRGATYALPQG